MTDFRVSEDRLGLAAIRSFRDPDEVDIHYRKVFKGREVASRKPWPPVGFLARVKWEWNRMSERKLS